MRGKNDVPAIAVGRRWGFDSTVSSQTAASEMWPVSGVLCSLHIRLLLFFKGSGLENGKRGCLTNNADYHGTPRDD